MYKFLIIIFLLIFTICFILYSINPKIEDKKHELMDYFYEDSIPFDVITKNNYIDKINKIKYPVIFKPSFCSSFGNEVELIKSENKALSYIKKTKDKFIIIQELHPGPYEGTILFEKNPITNNVNIVFVERINPNNPKNKNWFWKSSESDKFGYYSVHKPEMETEKLKNYVINVANKIPDFYLGRFDIRFKNHKDVKNGENIGIIELNGQFCSDTRYNDNKSFSYNLYIFIRWIYIRILFGLCNILRGNSISMYNFFKKIYYENKVLSNCYSSSKYVNVLGKLRRSFIKM